MPRGDKSKYTDKQKRKAEHIAEGYEHRGVPAKEAKRRAWATVNKMTGGGKKSGSGKGNLTVVEGVKLEDFGRQKFETTLKELQEERDAVKDLIGA